MKRVSERVIEENRSLTEADFREMWEKIDLSG